MSRLRTATLTLATAATAAALAAPAAATAQSAAEPYPMTDRPHAAVTLRGAGGVAPTRLEVSVRREGSRRLSVDVVVGAQSAGQGSAEGVLRIGSCPDAQRQNLLCRTHVTRRLDFGGGDELRVRARVPRPGARQALQVTLSRTDDRDRRIGSGTPASLFLPDEAWTAGEAGESFGAALDTTQDADFSLLRVDAAGLSDTAVRETIRFTATAATPLRLLWGCRGARSCDASARTTRLGAKARTEQRRPRLSSPSGIVGATGSIDDAEVFSVNLPRPLR